MRALIVEDDIKTANFVARGLFEIGLSNEIVNNGEDALVKLVDDIYDIAIVDIQLPGLSGFELIRRLRESGNKIPVLILSALNQTADRISGLNIGADDYLTKPFALNELTARVNAILRRTAPHASDTLVIRHLSIHRLERKAYLQGKLLDLTPREYALLEYMAQNANRTVTADMILRNVWGDSIPSMTTVVESMVCKLRHKLCPNKRSENLIFTVRGFGYVLR